MLGHWLFGLSTIDFLDLTEADRTLEYRSFGWNSAQGASLLPWMQTGCTLHFARRFSHSRFFEWIRDHRITFAIGIPTVINMLLDDPVEDRPRGHRLAPLHELEHRAARARALAAIRGPLRHQACLQFYGCSEGGWVCGNRHDYCRKGTVGPPAKHQELLIVDEDGKRCPPGVEGEVTLGGPQCVVAAMSVDGEWEESEGPAHPSRRSRA